MQHKNSECSHRQSPNCMRASCLRKRGLPVQERPKYRNRDQYPDKWRDPQRYAPLKLRAHVLKRDLYRCRYCGQVVTWQTSQIDHIKAWSKLGKTVAKNMVTACRACNQSKWAYTIKPMPLKKHVSLFATDDHLQGELRKQMKHLDAEFRGIVQER